MKKINKYFIGGLLFVATAMSLTSCDLDEYNPSSEGADAVFATQQGIEGLVNQMYYNFRWKYYGREDPVLYMEGAGDLFQNAPEKDTYGMQLTRFVDLQGDRSQVGGAWNRVYDNVNLANTVLDYLPTTKNLTDAQRDDYEGEARFTRAYAYWWLVEWFGDIEMRTKGTGIPNFVAYRTDRKVIYDEVILPDAEAATKLLPIKPLNDQVGRATRKAAYGILARTYLARAQYETDGSAEQKAFYQKAYEAAKYVMDHKSELGIATYATYDEIWQAKNNKSNTEYMWVVTHSSNSTLNPQKNNPNRLHMYWSPRLLNMAGLTNNASKPLAWQNPRESILMCPSYYLLNLYKDWDIRYDVLFQEEFVESNTSYTWAKDMADLYTKQAADNAAQAAEADAISAELVGKTVKEGDPVLRFTRQRVSFEEKMAAAKKGIAIVDFDDIFTPENIDGQTVYRYRKLAESSQNIYRSYPKFNKYRIWDGLGTNTKLLPDPTSQAGFADVPVMRYAEMPLIAAECQIGLGNASEAASIINREIRTARVVKPGHNLSEAQVSASDMTIEWILEERARELCGEWLRWFDLKRTKTLVSYKRIHNPATNGDNPVSATNYLWPIPTSFLDKLENAEEFGQNPGYNPYVRAN
ncbi:MAG: RagB/SusD family nutrient uptake outer membrane protein [Prevotella sp.]|nr:RagB/SusD family nutrient uptake outer membrane protein [Prevotella sp.]